MKLIMKQKQHSNVLKEKWPRWSKYDRDRNCKKKKKKPKRCDGTLPNFHFLESKRLWDIVSTEGIGSLESERNQSSVNAKTNTEAIADREEQFVLTRTVEAWTTRTAGKHRNEIVA